MHFTSCLLSLTEVGATLCLIKSCQTLVTTQVSLIPGLLCKGGELFAHAYAQFSKKLWVKLVYTSPYYCFVHNRTFCIIISCTKMAVLPQGFNEASACCKEHALICPTTRSILHSEGFPYPCEPHCNHRQ